MTDRIRRLHTDITSHHEAGLIAPVMGLDEVGVLLKMAAFTGHMVATVANPGISAGIRD